MHARNAMGYIVILEHLISSSNFIRYGQKTHKAHVAYRLSNRDKHTSHTQNLKVKVKKNYFSFLYCQT